MRSTKPSETRSGSTPPSAIHSGRLPTISATDLVLVREPPRWTLDLGERRTPTQVLDRLVRAWHGVAPSSWNPPPWLHPYQARAARRLASVLEFAGGGILADATGLGKTYTALGVATRYERVLICCPAVLRHQWESLVGRYLHSGPDISFVTHERLSRGAYTIDVDLVVVDEAHRFRNSKTRRYERLSRLLGSAALLLITATPVVNDAADLLSLFRLFLPVRWMHALGMSTETGIGDRTASSRFMPFIVARPPEVIPDLPPTIPALSDSSIHCSPPAPPPLLRHLVGEIRRLSLPGLEGENVRNLIRLHLLWRLGSGVEALKSSLVRHRSFLDHQHRWLVRGEVPTRRFIARLLNPLFPDQLSLIPPPLASMTRSSQKDLRAEVARIDGLLRALQTPTDDPKKRLLSRLVAQHRGRKIVVFCACIDTAHALAGYLGWDRVGLVTGRGAHIASGPLGTSTLLSLFAPSAQRNPNRVHPREEITVLIATDMLSEGVNLQDAEVVVHYDLPWTPLRLQQRIGRIARLDSPHRVIRVEWFAPPADLGTVLRIGPILERKSTIQDTLGVAVTTRPGRARTISRAWAAREEALEWASASWEARNAGPVHAVVSHSREAVVALRFTWEHGSLDVVYATDVTSGALTDSIERVGRVMSRLRECRTSRSLPPPSLLQRMHHVAGTWLSQSMLARGGTATDTLIRRTLDLARTSAYRRNGRFVTVLNRTLDRAINGLRAGAEGELHDCLGQAPSESCLHSWLARWSSRPVSVPSVQVLAALIGVGEEAGAHDGSSSTTPESSRSS